VATVKAFTDDGLFIGQPHELPGTFYNSWRSKQMRPGAGFKHREI